MGPIVDSSPATYGDQRAILILFLISDTRIEGEGGRDLFPFHGCFRFHIPVLPRLLMMLMCSVSLSDIHSVSQLNDDKSMLIEISCGCLYSQYICVYPNEEFSFLIYFTICAMTLKQG